MSQREFDVVVYGASGFTGRLVAEYLAHGGADPGVRWAMAGRNAAKLEQVRDAIAAPATTPLLVADADDPEALATLAGRARVVITTVGPYQLYGAPLIAACVTAGTDYVDLCGEPLFMRQIIDAHGKHAAQTGCRLVFSCGFDSVPFDFGVWFLQQAAQERFGAPCSRVRGRVRSMVGSFSGGTAASLKATLNAIRQDRSLVSRLADPFALTPGFSGPEQPAGNQPLEDPDLGVWLAPFVMAPINTKNVHRSNMLLGHAYGRDFTYNEMMVAGEGEAGKATALAMTKAKPLTGPGTPKPGEGPGKEEREAGSYELLFIGSGPNGERLSATVTGDRDPGYGSTSRMIAQCAQSLLADVPNTPGGIYTPAAIFDTRLLTRLQERAGLSFSLEP